MTLSYEERVAWAEACALLVEQCPWCGRNVRPCNLARHISKEHHKQLTIYDALRDLHQVAQSLNREDS